MEIHKVAVQGEIIEISFTTIVNGKPEKDTKTSKDEPRAQFTEAFAALEAIPRAMLGLPDEWDLSIRSFTQKADDKGFVVAFSRKIVGINSPLNISTPLMTQYGDGEERETTTLEDYEGKEGELNSLITDIVREAQYFVTGKRKVEQGDLFNQEANNDA